MDDQTENSRKLKTRLYMNSLSKSGGLKQTHLHEHNRLVHKLSGELLVPKIYADSHRKQGTQERSMTILRGKLVLEKQQWHIKPQESTKRATVIASKEPMHPIQHSELTEQGRTLAKKQRDLHKKQRFNKELVMNLSPRNIFSFFESHPDMHLDFFYLNKYSHPYDYRIVQFNERNQDEYMTISCKGVTQFIQKDAHFLTREEWIAEQDMYYKLQTIDFFSNYKLNKNFRIWKNLMKQHYMKEMSNLLNDKLFAASNSQMALLNIKRLCLQLEDECKVISYDTHQPYTLEEFQSQLAHHQNVRFIHNVRHFEKRIVEELVLSIQKSVQTYKEENNLVDRKEEGIDPHKDRLDYSKEALLRMHYVKIARFVKLADSMLLEAKATMMQNNLQQLLDVLINTNKQCKDDWMLCRADWNGYVITWTPDRNQIKDVFSAIATNALNMIHQDKFWLDQQRQFLPYRSEDEKMDHKRDERTTIKEMCRMNEDYNRKRVEIADQLDVAFDKVEDEQLKVMEFANIYERHQRQDIKLDDLSIFEVRKIIEEYNQEELRMEAMPERVELGLLLLDFTDLRKRIKHAPAHSKTRLFEMLPKLLESKSERVALRVQEFNTELTQPPAKVQSFVTYTKSVSRASECLDELASASAELSQLMCLMEQLKLAGLEKYRHKVKGISGSVALLKQQIQKSNASYDRNLGNFRRQLDGKIKNCEALLKVMQERYAETPLGSRDSDIDSMLEFVEVAKPQVELLNQQASEVNYLEMELSLERTSFEKLRDFHREFGLVEQLWSGRRQWRDMVREAKDKHFLQVDHTQLRSHYDDTIRLSCYLLRELETNEVTKVFYDQVLTFELVISTLAALHDPHLREKQQWEEIPRFLQRSKYPERGEDEDPQSYPLANRNDPIYTVNWIISEQIYLHREQLAYFGTKAAREEQLASTLKSIKAYMHEAQLTLISCTDGKEGLILGNNDHLFAQVDEKLMVLNNILASKYVDNIRLKVETLVKQFRYLQEMFDEMLLHQRNWLYLQPLLSSSSYSSKSLTKESKEFVACDGAWRRVAKIIRDNPCLKKLTDDMTNGCYIRRTLSKNNVSFQQIKKLLEDYVERKRAYFPRFYFLSSDKVLQMLSKARSIAALQPYLPLLFQQVSQFIHDPEQPTGIMGVTNRSQEQLLFRQFSLRPQAESEEIMKAVEQQIKKNLSMVIRGTLPRYEEESLSRMQLIEQFPTQVASIVDWILWTKFTEEYLDGQCLSDIAEWKDLQVQQVAELVVLLRGGATRRQGLCCMILQSISMRQRTDTLQKRMVTSLNDYYWLSAVKFYFGGSGMPEIYMRQFNGRLPYGFEFQDAQDSLVVMTPETERVLLGFHLAHERRLFPSVSGKCGSGKTQTCRQLAAMLAQNYIENTCSELTTLRSMERVILGTAITGRWLCFDQWENISSEVLSVLAGHLFSIRKALLEGKDSLFLMKGVVQISPNINIVFLSGAEAPSGRSLAGVLREVTVVAPPLTIVAQGLLECYGFSQIQTLTDYFSRLLSYYQTVLSLYCPCVFDIKTLRNVIEAMSDEIQHSADEQNSFCIAVKKVMGINMGSQAREQLHSFLGLLTGNFSRNSTPLQSVPEQCTVQSKAAELVKSVSMKSGTLVVGASLQGKTTIIKQAAKLAQRSVYFVNHGCYSAIELFGESQGTTGVFPLLLKNAGGGWIVLDGTINNFTQSLFSLLCGLINKADEPSWRLLLQTDSLASATPYILHRSNVVTVQSAIPIEKFIEEMLFRQLDLLAPTDFIRALSQLLASSLKKLIGAKRQLSLAVKVSEQSIARACCKSVKLLFSQLDIKLTDKDLRDSKRIVQRVTVWAIGWGLGCFINSEAVGKFESALTELFKIDNVPPGGVMAHSLTTTFEWVQWDTQVPTQILDPNEAFEELMIWTGESYCCRFFIAASIAENAALMLMGPHGTGKSKVLRRTISDLTKDEHRLSKLIVTLSNNTRPTTLQTLIEDRLQNQRRNGQTVAMPPPGKKLVVEVDDIGLDSSSQPALEFLRQQLSHNGMFDRRSYMWKLTEGLVIGAVARQPITESVQSSRFLNLFNLFLLKESDSTMTSVFTGLVKTWLKSSSLNEQLTRTMSAGCLAQATLCVYDFCRRELKGKSQHPYLLNYTPRDVFYVLQSISRISSSNYTKIEQIARLWTNEVLRTFSDRLDSQELKNKLNEFLKKQLFLTFKYDASEVLFKQPMLYGIGIDSDTYSYLNYESTCLTLRQKMIELSPRFSLLLFKQLVEHIIHVLRVLSLPHGSMLLIGPNASGKKSIVQLACFVAKVGCELELQGTARITKCLIDCAQGTPSCLVFNEQSLRNQERVSQLNCLLNRTICQLESSKELSDKISGLPTESKHDSVLDIFFELAYKHLHIALTVPPSQFLRNLILENRQLTSCCAVDFMTHWPDEALYEVAEINMSDDIFAKDQKTNMARIASLFHRAVESTVEMHKLPVLISPRRYLELISLFSFKYQVRKEEAAYVLGKLQKCIEKQAEATTVWSCQQTSLRILEEVFKESMAEQQRLTEQLDSSRLSLEQSETEQASEQRQLSMDLTALAISRKSTYEQIQQLSEQLVGIGKHQVWPIISSLKELEGIRNSLLEVLQLEPVSPPNELVTSTAVFTKLKSLPLLALPLEKMTALENSLSHSDTSQPIQVVEWLQELCKLHKQLSDINNKEYGLVSNSKRRVTLLHSIASLELQLSETRRVRLALETDLRQTRQRVRTSRQFQEKIAHYHQAWSDRFERQSEKLRTLLPDLFFACSVFSYLGPFSQIHREEIILLWKGIIQVEKLAFGSLEFAQTLFDELEVESLRMYTQDNLLSCLMMIKNPLTPYLIDPDQVATKYLKSIYPEIKCLRFGEDGFVQSLERAVKEGAAVLIEYNHPSIDPLLRPLLGTSSSTGGKRIVKIGDAAIECHDSFKLFLCNRIRSMQICTDAYDSCCVIDFNLTHQSIKEVLEWELLDLLAEHDQRIMEDEVSRASDLKVSLKAKNEKVLSLVEGLDLHGDFNLVHEAVQELKKLEDKKQQLTRELAEQQQRISQLTLSHTEFKHLSQGLAVVAQFGLHGIHNLHPSYGYSFGQFVSTLRKAVRNPQDEKLWVQVLSADSTKTIVDRVVSIMLQDLMRVARSKDKARLRLMLLLQAETCLRPTLNYKQLFQRLTPGKPEQTMDKPKLIQWLQQSSVFGELIDRFSEDEELEEWLTKTDLTRPNCLYGPYVLSPVQKLFLLKANSKNYTEATDKLIGEYFSEKKKLTILEALTTESNNRTPVCLICEGADPTVELLALARQRKMGKDSVVVAGLDSHTRLSFQKAVESASWIVLMDIKPTGNVESFVNQVVATSQLREDFRLVLVASRECWSGLAERMRGRCLEMSLEAEPIALLEEGLRNAQCEAEAAEKQLSEQTSQPLVDFYKATLNSKRLGITHKQVLQAVCEALSMQIVLPEPLGVQSLILTMMDLLNYQSSELVAESRVLLSQCLGSIKAEDAVLDGEQSHFYSQDTRSKQQTEKQQEQPANKLQREEIESLLSQLPNPIAIGNWQPNDSILCYLHKECINYNALLHTIKDDTLKLMRYLSNQSCESCSSSQSIMEQLQRNIVPKHWNSSYVLSQTTFTLWLEQFRRNFELLKKWWTKEQRPRFLNINMLFRPSAFLQVVLLKWAKKMKLRLQRVCFSSKVLGLAESESSSNQFTINLADIYLRGCRYDQSKGCVEQQQEPTTDPKFGIIQLTPSELQKTSTVQQLVSIRIPIYRSERCHSPDEVACHIDMLARRKVDQQSSNMNFSGYCERHIEPSC